MENIRIERTQNPKPKPTDEANLPFGRIFTDHMFVMDYTTDAGWHDARVVPYGPFSLDPATSCLHYGQLIFEGMKAYRGTKDEIVLFRPEKNMARMNDSCHRMCIPPIDEASALSGIAKLISVDGDWVPSAPGTSLYIRPFIFSSGVFLGVHPSDKYVFAVILCPVGPYYKSGLAPVRIYVEREYTRAAKGGTGAAKCAGNYAGSLLSQVEAERKGFSQVLWLDGVERRYIEEVGAMNVFFVIGDEVVTPALNGSILPGITRDSVLTVLRGWGMKAVERQISIDELTEAYKTGKLKEAFQAGTAAVISPIGELTYGDTVMSLTGGKIGEITQKVYDEITGIQRGERRDERGWVRELSSLI